MDKFVKLLLLTLSASPCWASDVVMIGHPDVPRLSPATVQKLYEGRLVAVGGVAITAVNAPAGTPLRNRFLASYLGREEEDYTAYWTVRRFIGKGAPPQVLPSIQDVINFVQNQPGAVGYVDVKDLRPGMNLVLER